jgi:ABC-2 type transport system ATP-binding protein
MQPKPPIECQNLYKSFGKKSILKGIDFQIPPGGILGLVGPNGAGKTTLMKILATLITPSGGKVNVLGVNIANNSTAVKKVIGLALSEERNFYWRLSGRQNLKFFGALYDIPEKERSRRVDTLIQTVGLGDKGDLQFRKYSSGMKQALGIARAMLHDPPILLMDEPTRSLSPNQAHRIRRLLHKGAKEEGKAILLSSHNLREVQELADRIAIIDNGEIKALGTLAELKQLAGMPSSVNLDRIFQHFIAEERDA